VEVHANRVRVTQVLDRVQGWLRWPWGYRLGGEVTFHHLYIVYTTVRGDVYYYRGGPSNPGPPFGAIRIEYGRYVPGTVDWADQAITATVAEGKAAEGLESCFERTLAAIAADRIEYATLGPNSNTVVKTLLWRCGLPMAQPVAFAPGFDDPPLVL
jgi:hypothetical protein